MCVCVFRDFGRAALPSGRDPVVADGARRLLHQRAALAVLRARQLRAGGARRRRLPARPRLLRRPPQPRPVRKALDPPPPLRVLPSFT